MALFNKTSWWPLKIERFETSNHPAITTTDKKTEEVQFRLTHNELQILEGLAKIFECKKGDAVRIALHTRHNKAQATPERTLGGREGGRTNRVKVRLTDYEYDLLSAIGGSLSDNLRHIVWDTSSLIKAGRLSRIPGCRRRTEKEKNKNWIANNKGRGKGSTLTRLIDAQQEALDEARDAAADRYEEVGIYADNLRYEMGSAGFNSYFGDETNGKIDMYSVMDHMQMGANVQEDAELEAIHNITDRAEGIKALAMQLALWTGETVEECMEQAEEEWDEEHEEIDEEELDCSWMDDITYPNSDVLNTDISVYRAD